MRRRELLRAAAWTVGGGLVGGGAGLAGLLGWVQPRRHTLRPLADDDARRPERLASPRRVVVVGGGVAGIAAATELAARGFAVTLVERAPHLGGKVAGWPLDLPASLGGRVPMEHGFHGFFRQYYNLDELLAAAGVGADLVDPGGYPVLLPGRAPEVFGTTSRLFPLNLAQVIARSPSLRLGEFRDDGPGLTELMRYRADETFARFDGISFTEMLRRSKVHGGMVGLVLRPFGKTTLNALDRLSAAEAIRFFHFYFMGNPEGLGFRCLRRDAMTAVIDPLARRLEALGGRIERGVRARRLVRAGDRVVGVEVDRGSASLPRVRVLAADVPASGWLPLDSGEGPVFLARGARPGSYVALDGRCTHMGCAVALDPSSGGFRCPCHAGRYDAAGRPVAGPPKRALDPVPVEDQGEGRLAVGGGRAVGGEVLPCDYAVVACEVRGLRRLVAASDLGAGDGAAAFRFAVDRLGEADPYAVVRFWFDRPTAPGRAAFYTMSGYPYTDAIAIYSAFQEPYVSWARAHGGSVVETHAYAIPPAQQGPLARYRDALLDELRRALPELADARVLHEEAMAQDNFTRFAPGDHALRPSTTTPLANLFLAGDHVRLPFPAFLMEAAAASARLAANRVLHAEGVREVPISTVALAGPLA